MKKFLLFSLLLTICLSGCSLFEKKDTSNSTKSAGSNTANSSNEIVNAMQTGKKMQCTYTDKENNVSSTIYVDGKKFKTVAVVDGQEAYSIFDGTTHYSWGVLGNQGYKISDQCMNQQTQGQNNSTNFNADEFSQASDFNNALDIKCNAVANIDFSLPTNINFIDACNAMNEMNQQNQEMMQSFKNENNINAQNDNNNLQEEYTE